MTAAALLDRLERVRKTGADRWAARCPAHADKGPSLSVRELDDGRVLLHCFAGCEVSSVLSAVGLDFEALYPEKRIDDRRPREKRPFSVRDLIRALDFELTVALVILSDVAAGRPTDRERAGVAAERIAHFLGELQRAC